MACVILLYALAALPAVRITENAVNVLRIIKGLAKPPAAFFLSRQKKRATEQLKIF